MLKELAEILATVLAAVGGFEAVKWLVNRKAERRKAAAAAAEAAIDAADKGVSSYERTNAILSGQVEELTRKLSDSISTVVELKAEVAGLKAQVGALIENDRRYRCERSGCAERVPPNGY